MVLQSGAAHDLLVAVIAAWITVEVVLRLRSAGRRLAWDWTFPVVVAVFTAGVSLGLKAAHLKTGNIGGGWGPVAIGLIVAVCGIALRGRGPYRGVSFRAWDSRQSQSHSG